MGVAGASNYANFVSEADAEAVMRAEPTDSIDDYSRFR